MAFEISRKFDFEIQKGQIVDLDTTKVMKHIASRKNGYYSLVIRKKTRNRSNKQNRFLWGVVYKILSDETGHSDEDVHRFLTGEFLKDRTGAIHVVKSTKDLTTKEFEDYIEKIRVWSSETLNIYIPTPNEVAY